jgi:RHS repeat-associated protein
LYIDSVILRDRDADNTGGWAGSPDGTLEERTYYVQNWRADVVALLTDAGQLIQQIRYDGLTPAAARRGGVPFGISKTDLDANGLVNLLDYSRWLTLYDNGSGTHPYADWNWDGTVDSSDESAFLADRSSDTSLGRGVLGYGFDHVGGNSRKGYAGYEEAVELEGVKPGTYHVRHRAFLAELGRWTKRDPIGYVDGANLYRYASISPLVLSDPMGLRECRSGCGDEGGGGSSGGGGGAWRPRDRGGERDFGTSSVMMYDSITKALQQCASHPSKCLKYNCMKLAIETFNDLCGGCHDSWLRHFTALEVLWCTKNKSRRINQAWCDAQKTFIDQMCKKPGKCKGKFDRDKCDEYEQILIRKTLCIGLYEHFDQFCAKGPGGKRDPTRHRQKIREFKNTVKDCARFRTRCEAQGA